MKTLSHILITCILVCCVSLLHSQRFACDGQLLIASNDGVSTTIYRPIYIPFSQPFLSPFSKYFNGSFDALGFNSKDNFIYGVEEHTNTIVRLKQGNTFERIGVVDFVDTLKVYAGDCTPEGLYICYEENLGQLLVFDVVDGLQLRERIDLFWDTSSGNSGSFHTSVFDFAIDPNNPTQAYAYQGTAEEILPASSRGSMLRINLDFDDANLGMVTTLDVLGPGVVSHLGGLIYSPESTLYGYGTAADGLNPPQDKLFVINAFGGPASIAMANSQAGIRTDGCSCPYAFTFSNRVPSEGIYCNNDSKIFKLKINNYSYNPVNDIVLRDTFPEGMIVESVTGNFDGNILPSSFGSHILVIENLNIPPKSEIDINIKVRSIDAEVGALYNQAFLENLPPRFDGNMASDELATTNVSGDPSFFYVIPRSLENVSWEVISPTDCIIANDGKIIVSSEQFFPGQDFEIKLRNKIGWDEFTYTKTVNDDNALEIDSLLPGDYQIFQLRSLSDNCSLALRDTTILLEAPNDLLTLEVESNSPICEGEDLMLNSTISPSGSIRWTGPLLFGSEALDPVFENAIADRAGEYKAVATYGYCTSTQFLEADVRPMVDGSIEGDMEYCERDSMKLIASGAGDMKEYFWTGPYDFVSSDSSVVFPRITKNQDGYYQVIVSNGACFDTVGTDITVLPTPSIAMDTEVKTDYCSPLRLMPEILGDTDVDFLWLPREGLSCSDCANPLVIPIVQASYKLNVENQYQCSDSANINIFLDKEKLVFAPNVLNANSRVGNDQFTFLPGCVVQSIESIEVYNRWGNKVYSAESVSDGASLEFWDGYTNDKRASAGVYIWFAKVVLVDGTIQYLSGDVTLLGA